MANISIRYQIAQKVRNWRLKRKYTLKDLAGKANINYHTLIRYEQGTCGIPTEKLKILAESLSIPIRNLFPRRKVLKEDSCFDKAKTQEMYNFIEKYKKIEGRKAIYALTKSIRTEEESNIKAARIRIANNLVKEGFDNDIVYRATGLSIEEYADKESIGCASQNGGQEIKKWRIIRGYTQEELAKKLNVGPSQIHHYEQGSVTVLSERLWEIARELSVDTEDLIKEEDNYEDGEAENELLSWAREYRKIDNQESRDELNIWVEFLLQRKQIYKEKINKIEGMKVVNNLLQLGFSTDVISKIID
ncbi:helix-turn-helix transcriptional regulator [Wolbachia endosymbiont of Corcyra cephalonica]|uniref:WO male-killing family protein Wmk n=2 Tax=Wolbachia TaxID=953 RepID=UPI001E3EAA25|nr:MULTISPECIES: helix-turn-helix transcriptional regulator [unclassified Wolbachia]UFO00280.1 helix-turn-helix transcriptional regulator [Wolbachia endosymbiont of Corcyra cephalonica]